jgi:hypothetical protein
VNTERTARDDLISRAKERAESPPTPEEWGYRIVLGEGESFVGRWRDRTVDEDNNDRPIYLFWDDAGEWCFSRHYASLERELTREDPAIGATVVIYRGRQLQDPVRRRGRGVRAELRRHDRAERRPAARRAAGGRGGIREGQQSARG